MCKFVLKQRNAKSPVGAIRDIVIDNVIARPRGTSTMTGHATRPLENIRMSNVQLHMLPEDAKDKRATHALRVEGVSGLGLRDVSMDWADETEPKWGSAVALRRVTDFRIEAFRGRQGLAGTETPVLVIEDCVDGAIVDARATAGARRFLHVEGEATRDITVRDIRMSDQGRTVTYGGEALRSRVQVR
jgi:hypothetical protein